MALQLGPAQASRRKQSTDLLIHTCEPEEPWGQTNKYNWDLKQPLSLYLYSGVTVCLLHSAVRRTHISDYTLNQEVNTNVWMQHETACWVYLFAMIHLIVMHRRGLEDDALCFIFNNAL